MKKKLLVLTMIGILFSFGLCGCSLINEADIVSNNISTEADNFNVYRKITVLNNQTDSTMLEFEGWCSIKKDNNDKQLEITYRTGKDKYYKDFIGLNDRTSYVITQIDGSNVDKYHYTWMYHSKGDLIPIQTKDNDANN